MAEKDRDENRTPETKTGTSDDKDFGGPARNANQDDTKTINFTTTGDGTSWDNGRQSSITEGTRLENDLREADAEAPGVTGPKPGRSS